MLRDVPGKPASTSSASSPSRARGAVGAALEQRDLVGEPRGRTCRRAWPAGRAPPRAGPAPCRCPAPRCAGGRWGRCDERRVLLAVLLVDALDQLLADVAREVEVDVRQRVQRLVEEAAEEELGAHRVDVGEPDQVADDRGHRRSPAASRRQPVTGRAGVGRGPRARPPWRARRSRGRPGRSRPARAGRRASALCAGEAPRRARCAGGYLRPIARRQSRQRLDRAAVRDRRRRQDRSPGPRSGRRRSVARCARVGRRLRVVLREAVRMLRGRAQEESALGRRSRWLSSSVLRFLIETSTSCSR